MKRGGKITSFFKKLKTDNGATTGKLFYFITFEHIRVYIDSYI